jgi:hypothetical protein
MKYFKDNYHKISQTERYKQSAKKFNYKHYHERDEETIKSANRKYYLAKKAKMLERRRLEEQEKKDRSDHQQDVEQVGIKKRGRPRHYT